MIIPISLLFIAILFLSIFCGVFLAYHTCEELAIIGKYLEIIQYALSILGFLYADFLLFGLGFTSFAISVAIIVGAFLIFGIRRYFSMTRTEFSRFQSTAEMLAFAALLALFAIRNDLVLASTIFLLGLVIGTVGTKRYLFATYDHKRFTTLTTFSLKEKTEFYLNALKEYHWVLYPALLASLMTVAI